MGKFSKLGSDLYTGRRSYDFVTHRLAWYLVSIILVASAAGIVMVKGLNFGIEFTGGTELSVALPADQVNQDTADQLRETVAESGLPTGEPNVTTSGDTSVIVQTKKLSNDDSTELIGQIAQQVGIPASQAENQISATEIGESLGASLAQRAALGVGVFLLLVVLFIWAYSREWKMSAAGLVALFHDIAITVGVYALSGFAVTPAAVTGLLAILGFSLYDTVVVFDKIRENTKNLRASRTTYPEAANLAVNQTLVRSINTSIVALIPIGSILYVSAVQLGASSLKDLALSQFVGMGVGVYSSLFLAPRVLVQLKATEDDVKLAEKRARARERAQVDRYASVPSFAEDMPIEDDPDEVGPRGTGEETATGPGRSRSATATRRRPGDGRARGEDPERGTAEDYEAYRTPSRRGEPPASPGKGRTVPESKRSLDEGGTAGRRQPSRQSKSQRKK